MIHLLRTDAAHPDFVDLVRALDAYLTITDGDEHAFYDQYNQLDAIKHVVVAYYDGRPAGCGAIKAFSPDCMEVKRMFTAPEYREKGIATAVIMELEAWASEMQYQKCILETGKRQEEAVLFYHRKGYKPISNYGQYIGVENSVCFEKIL